MENNEVDLMSLIESVGVEEDVVKRRDTLVQIGDRVTILNKQIEDLNSTILKNNETIEKNNADMESLRQANMKLFLRLDSGKTEEEVKEDSTGIKDPESNKPQKRSFDDLFKTDEMKGEN